MRFSRSTFAVNVLVGALVSGGGRVARRMRGSLRRDRPGDGGDGTDALRPAPADADTPVDAERPSDASVPDAAVETFVFSDTFDTSGNTMSPVWDSPRLEFSNVSREVVALTGGSAPKAFRTVIQLGDGSSMFYGQTVKRLGVRISSGPPCANVA